jgi:hypothetical protein
VKLTEKHFIVGSSKNGYIFSFIIILALLTTFTACSENSAVNVETESSSKSSKKIYLYGEKHGVKKIMDKEFELWHEYYNNKNMRHLFVELPYYTAEFLNIWMKSDSDEILDELYNDWIGTALYNPYTKEFYKKIKSNCPETIFHGTDVGHQYDTTGQRFLKYLEENNLKDSEKYRLAHEAVKQGKYYYENSDDVYRENKMVENFIREYDALNGECIMGIYGNAHTSLDAMDFTDSVPCMANQLKDIYKDIIYSEDLSWLAMNPFERIVYWLFEKK